MFKLDFKIFQLPASGNTFIHMHWAKKGRYSTKWHNLVYFETIGKTPKKPLEKCTIRIERYSARIQIDADNFITGSKPLFDGIKRAGIIMDDSLKVIGVPIVTFHKVPAKASPYIHIFIEETF